jgi:hypothetical protein
MIYDLPISQIEKKSPKFVQNLSTYTQVFTVV